MWSGTWWQAGGRVETKQGKRLPGSRATESLRTLIPPAWVPALCRQGESSQARSIGSRRCRVHPGSTRAFNLYTRSPTHTLQHRSPPHGGATRSGRENGANCVFHFGNPHTGWPTIRRHRAVRRAIDLYSRSPTHTLQSRGLPHGGADSKRRGSRANCIFPFGSMRTGPATPSTRSAF